MSFRPLTRDSIGEAGYARVARASPALLRRLLLAGSAALAGVALLQVYNRLSMTAVVTADSANAVLQGRAIAQGNVLLRGWTLSGASF
jgi:hypothetical protein